MAETFEDAPELLFFDTFSHEVNEVNFLPYYQKACENG